MNLEDERELQELAGTEVKCAFSGCDLLPLDSRGPIFMRDGSKYRVCTRHWEPIFMVIGSQDSGYGPDILPSMLPMTSIVDEEDEEASVLYHAAWQELHGEGLCEEETCSH